MVWLGKTAVPVQLSAGKANLTNPKNQLHPGTGAKEGIVHSSGKSAYTSHRDQELSMRRSRERGRERDAYRERDYGRERRGSGYVR